MKNYFKPLTVPLALSSMLCLTAGQALATETPDANTSNQGADSGFASNLYFTDELGNRRNPTAEERAELAKKFQNDLARMQGKNRGNQKSTKHANGSVSATVALSKLQFLTVQENADGTRNFSHQTMDEDGNVIWISSNDWPEE